MSDVGRWLTPPAGRVIGVSVGLAILASAAATSAAAQQAAPPVPDMPGEKRTDLSPAVEASYNTNVAGSGPTIAALRQVSMVDEVLSPTLTFDLLRPISRESLFARGAAGYESYKRNTRLSSRHIDMTVGADAFIKTCRATVSGIYQSQQSNLRDLADPTTITLVKNLTTTTGVNFDSGCTRPIGFTPTLTASDTSTGNSDVARQSVNNHSTGLSVGLTYQRPSIGQLNLFGQYRKVQFSNRGFIVNGALLKDGYQLNAEGLQFTRALGASRIQTTLQMSYTRITPNVPAAPRFSGLTYVASATVTPSSRATVNLKFERATNPSNRLGASFSRDDNYSAEVDYVLNSRIRLTTGVSRAIKQYEGVALRPDFDLVSETLNSVFGGVNYQINPRLSLLLNVANEQRDANLHLYNYVSTRTSLTLTGHF